MKLLLFCFPGGSIFFSCSTNGKFKIEEAGKDTVGTILAKTTPGNFKLFITGEVDDSFNINNINLKGGKINDTITLDWYDKTIIINYKAYKAKKGKLNFSYFIPGYF